MKQELDDYGAFDSNMKKSQEQLSKPQNDATFGGVTSFGLNEKKDEKKEESKASSGGNQSIGSRPGSAI